MRLIAKSMARIFMAAAGDASPLLKAANLGTWGNRMGE
jgi:hypothetical protein